MNVRIVLPFVESGGNRGHSKATVFLKFDPLGLLQTEVWRRHPATRRA
jgi:hypothetical protein